jgi:hypothetical protein
MSVVSLVRNHGRDEDENRISLEGPSLECYDWFQKLCRRLRFHVSNISLLRKLAEDARKDARLWASRPERADTVDADFPLDEGDDGEERATIAEHDQNFAAVLHTLQNAVRDFDDTRGSPVLTNFTRDLLEDFGIER